MVRRGRQKHQRVSSLHIDRFLAAGRIVRSTQTYIYLQTTQVYISKVLVSNLVLMCRVEARLLRSAEFCCLLKPYNDSWKYRGNQQCFLLLRQLKVLLRTLTISMCKLHVHVALLKCFSLSAWIYHQKLNCGIVAACLNSNKLHLIYFQCLFVRH